MRLLLALIVWGGSLVGGFAVANAAAGGVGSASSGQGGHSTQVGPAPKPPFDPSLVKAADPRSMLVGSNFAKGLAVAERHLGRHARAKIIQIYPGQLLLTIDQGHRESNDAVLANGSWRPEISSPAVPVKSIRLSSPAGDAPSILLGRLAAKLHLHLSQISYIAVQANPTASGLLYYVYGTGSNMYFQATSPHSAIRRLGGSDPVVVP
jgi:hypothetical protein